MQNIYPLFERNRILKKELLWSLRDYSFAHVQLEYQEYEQGIIRGCDVVVNGSGLTVKPGMIKYGRFICLMMEEETISYQPDEKMQYLKVRVEIDRSSSDYIAYRMDLILDGKEKQAENEFELCRFNLRKGAELRDRYTGFSDMVTEYDTINLIYADWGGLSGASINPTVTRYFAEKILAGKSSLPEDRFFAYLCLSQPGAVSPEVLSGYISQRRETPAVMGMDRPEIYHIMCGIAEAAGRGGEVGRKVVKGRHTIMVD